MDVSDIVVTLAIGGLAGWLATLLIGAGKKHGLLQNIIIGVVGAFIGDFVFGLLDISTEATFVGDLIVATSGAALLLLVVKILRK